MTPVVSIHDQLMCPTDEIQSVCLIELFTNVLAERIACSSWRDAPTHAVIRVRPQKVTDWSFVGDLLHSI
jgi:hypothetical protein